MDKLLRLVYKKYQRLLSRQTRWQRNTGAFQNFPAR